MKKTKKILKIMILEDEEDILTLYNDYFSGKGHQVVCKCKNANYILKEIEKEIPDVYILDYKLPGNKNGIEVALEILNKFPLANILFITVYEPLGRKVSNNPNFEGKNVEILLKPMKLYNIENSMINFVNKN